MKITIWLSSLAAAAILAISAYLVPKYGFVGSLYAIQYQIQNLNANAISQKFTKPGSASTAQASQTMIPFTYLEVDSTIAGDCKAVGDIDGDGQKDLVIGGMPGEKLNWYRYPNWNKTVIATPTNEFTTDCALGDVDGDTDLDIIVPDGDSGNNLVWFANPRPGGNPAVGSQWIRRQIGSIGSWGKDIRVSDFDSDGRLDVATRKDDQAMIFFQTAANTWTKMTFTGVDTGHEGMAMGDIDQDGGQDLVLHGVWVRNPGGLTARTPSEWKQYQIGPADSDFKALVVDLNKDGKMDVLFSSSENTADVNWWTPVGSSPTDSWAKQTIYPSLEKGHTLQVADMNQDGSLDVVLAQMHTSYDGEIFIMINQDGKATQWEKLFVGNGGLHNGVVADIGNDGDYDIFGANWTGNPPVKLWLNRQDSIGSLTYNQVTNSHDQTFGLAFGDLNGDQMKDIISGQYWYQNPGGDMLGAWNSTSFPSGMQAALFVDVDGDSLGDVIVQKDEGDIAIYWLEATDLSGTSWNQVKVGNVPSASHSLGAQGYKTGQVEAGGKPEILFSSGDGIYYFRIPANPTAGNWPRVHVNSNPSDEGFGLADFNRDGNLDIAATTGDSKRVEWYRNPGNGTAGWTAYHIGNFAEAVYPDRTEAADLNGDGKPDIIVTEENGEESDAETFWWQQPADPTSGNWTRHLIVIQGTTNSLDIGDINGDGKIDLMLAEHRGEKRLTAWFNDGAGNFSGITLASGYESHLGARLVDLDNDGDLDIVSIAWDDYEKIHLWRNNRASGTERSFLPMITKTSTWTFSPEAMVDGSPTESGALESVPPESPGASSTDESVIIVTGGEEQTTAEDYSPISRPFLALLIGASLALLLGLVLLARRLVIRKNQ